MLRRNFSIHPFSQKKSPYWKRCSSGFLLKWIRNSYPLRTHLESRKSDPESVSKTKRETGPHVTRRKEFGLVPKDYDNWEFPSCKWSTKISFTLIFSTYMPAFEKTFFIPCRQRPSPVLTFEGWAKLQRVCTPLHTVISQKRATYPPPFTQCVDA